MKDLFLRDRSFYFCRVKKLILICAAAFSLLVGCRPTSYAPNDHLTKEEQEDFKWSIIRYAGRSPEGLTVPERFYPQYDSHYRDQQALHTLDAYFEKDGLIRFMVSRKAPSLTDKRVATGGLVRINSDGQIEYYEEVFRTWKMVPDTLKKRSIFLFDRMVKGQSLEPYYTRNSGGIDYIEFPDDRTWFDIQERVWKMK